MEMEKRKVKSKEYIARRHKVYIEVMRKEMACDHKWVKESLIDCYTCKKCRYSTRLDPYLKALIMEELDEKM